MTKPPTERQLPAWVQYAVLLLILLANVALKAPNLGHPALRPMDESFHAVVARNLMTDPLKPMLVRDTYLDFDATDWLNSHVWLHKPVLPLWAMALSMKILGVSALALRLPSLILSTLAVGLTFLIARRLYGAVPGLVAAGIQAIVPTIGMVVQGYLFSDAIDVHLMFWSELSLWLMLLGSRKSIELSGAAAGAAFMSKTFPALFVLLPLALILILCAKGIWPAKAEEGDPAPASTQRCNAISMWWRWLIGFSIIALPWNLYCAAWFPTQFTAEYGLILTHLSSDVENWASPWDRLWFGHLPNALYFCWTTSLVGFVLLTFRAIQLRRWPWLFVPVWIVAVVVPFTLATSKTPTATMIAWPAFMIAAGFLVGRAIQGYVVELAGLVAVLVGATFFSGSFLASGWGITEPFALMRQEQWMAWHVVIALSIAAGALVRDVRLKGACLAIVPMVFLLLGRPAWRTGKLAWQVTRAMPSMADVASEVGARAGELPANAVIMLPKTIARRRNETMFYLDRTAYVLPDDSTQAQAMLKTVRDYGGEPWWLSFDDNSKHPVEFHRMQ